MMNFEEAATQLGKILSIDKEGVIARGIHISEVITTINDAQISAKSYPDTGIFVLFKGSDVSPAVKEKYKQYIDVDGKTTKEIVFQSRNAAAQFVLGDKGRTNDWK